MFLLSVKPLMGTEEKFFETIRDLKAMLHEAIFLATCNATMTNKIPFKLQRGRHPFATFFATCNAYINKQDGGRAKSSKDEL